MKICLIELIPFPYTVGGGTTILIELSRALAKMGHDVHVLSIKPENNQKQLEMSDKVKIHRVGIPHKIFEKGGLLSLPYKLIHRILSELSFVFGARSKINELRPDVCNPQSLITTALPYSLSNCKFVATLQGPYLEGFRKLWSDRKSSIVLSASKIYEMIERFNARRSSVIVCTGRETKEYYSRFQKCVIIPKGVDVNKFKRKSEKRGKVIVSVGRLTEQKRVENLVKSMDKLKNYKLYVGGLGPLKER